MEFGSRKKDTVEPGNYLRNFPKGETLVRFLDEPDDWNAYREHYSLDSKSFPCTGDRQTCPGCTDPNEKVSKAGRKYAAQVYLVKTEKVMPYKIPVTLADRLAIRAERNGGTLLTRDFVILKSGSGMDTEYDVDTEEKYPVDLDALRKKITLQIQDCHKDSFAEVWGADWQPGKPASTSVVTDIGRSAARGAQAAAVAPVTDEDPPSEPAAKQDAGEQGGDTELTEAQVRGMDKKALQELADRAGVTYSEDDSKSEIADLLIASFGE